MRSKILGKNAVVFLDIVRHVHPWNNNTLRSPSVIRMEVEPP